MKKLALLFLLASSVPAPAQESMAFAAAIAPEQAFEVCHMADAIKAAQCAINKCRKASGDSPDCVITSACTNGWAGAMGVTTGEVHWTETVCGAPNQAAAIAALKAFCKGQVKHAQQCFLSSVWDEKGNEKKIEQTWEPKKLK